MRRPRLPESLRPFAITLATVFGALAIYNIAEVGMTESSKVQASSSLEEIRETAEAGPVVFGDTAIAGQPILRNAAGGLDWDRTIEHVESLAEEPYIPNEPTEFAGEAIFATLGLAAGFAAHRISRP